MTVDAKTDRLVIGGGVVGLAIARAFAIAGDQVVLVEANPAFGMETSSRNSEVIHAGIYYPQGSLKARLCVEGARRIYDFAAERGFEARRCGKLIVATTEDQLRDIEALKDKGDANGVDGLEMISRNDLAQLEPDLVAFAALSSPMSGVVDSHGLMAALEADADNHGAIISCQSRFISATKTNSGFEAVIDSQGETITFGARTMINSAGHGARRVSLAIEGVPPACIPPHYMAKGQYFTCTRKPPFTHLIYPVPSGGGLGIHLIQDSGGGARFGPDIAWVDQVDYSVNPEDAQKFHALISQYWPSLEVDDLVPAWAGIRPKVAPHGRDFQDFMIKGATDHGCEGLVALYGIDSPGLTSSMAIADYVKNLADRD